MMLRSVVSGRSRSQSSGAAAGVRHVARRLRRTLERGRVRCSRAGAGIVLTYHRLDELGGDPSRELVPALATSLFEAQLKRLRSKYRIVPPSALLEEVRRLIAEGMRTRDAARAVAERHGASANDLYRAAISPD